MFHLVVMACLSADPSVCAERVLAWPEPQGEAECAADAPARVADWTRRHEGLVSWEWACRATAVLPALSVSEVAEGVYVHAPDPALLSPANGGDIANLGFIVGETVAVIDPGGSRAIGEGLFAAIRRITDRPISHVIITHMHPDHSFGAEVFAEAGAEIVGHANLGSAIERRADAWAESMPRQLGPLALLGTSVRLPDRGISAPEEIALGRATLRIVPVATAHTDNDLTILHVESGTLFTGDLVFGGLTPSIDGSLLGWLGWLAAPPQPPPSRIVAGHGPVPMNWAAGTAPVRSYLAALAEETRSAIRAGEAMSVAAAHVGAGLGGEWIGFEETNQRNAVAAFKELEWE